MIRRSVSSLQLKSLLPLCSVGFQVESRVTYNNKFISFSSVTTIFSSYEPIPMLSLIALRIHMYTQGLLFNALPESPMTFTFMTRFTRFMKV